MNSEERFKKDLNELLGSKEFAFDEANWEKAKKMIDASKKTKRRPLAYLISGAVFILSLLTGFYILLNNDAPIATTTTVPPVKNKTITKPDSKSNTLNQPADSKSYSQTVEASAILTETKPTAQTPETKEPQSEVKNLTLANSEPQGNTRSVKTRKPNATISSVFNIPVSTVAEVNEIQKETTKQNIKPEITPEQSSEFSHQEQVVEEKSAPDSNVNTSKETRPITTAHEDTVLEPATVTNHITIKPDVTELKNEAIAANETETKSATTALEENPASEPEPALTNDSLLKESIAAAHPTVTPENPDPVYEGVEPEPKYRTVRFSVEAGASYLHGWKNPKNRDANGFNPVFGLNCFNTFSPKLSFSFGIQYTSVGKLSYSNYTSKIIRLKLGEESDVSVYTPVKMHYVVFPLRLNYDLSVKNTVGFGCNAAYLVNLESELETYTEKPNSSEGYNITKTYGYTQGFKKYDVQASVFYQRRLYPNLSANVEAFFGLTDIKDNDFFKLNAFERNTGVKLTLVYNILKK